VRTIEVDELKIRQYGTSEKCYPSRGFPAAGRQAREFLNSGFHTFIIEAFAEKQRRVENSVTAAYSQSGFLAVCLLPWKEKAES